MGTWDTVQEAQATAAAAPLATGVPRPLGATPRALALRPGLLADLVALLASVLGLSAFGSGLDARMGLAVVTLAILLLALRGEYEDRGAETPLPDQLTHALSVAAVATMVVACLAVVADKHVAAAPFASAWLAAAVALGATRGLWTVTRGHARRHGLLVRRTLIVGAGRIGHLTADRLLRTPEMGLEPIGFLDKEPLPAPPDGADLPVFGASWDLERVVAEQDVGQVIVAFSTAPDDVLLSIVRRCHDAGVAVAVVPRLFEVHSGPDAGRLGGLPLLKLSPPRHDSRQLQVKYGLDRAFAALAILVLMPLLAAIAVGIRLTSGGPVFYRQRRAGRGGAPFWMHKFRTMNGDARNDGEADASWADAALGAPGAAAAAAPHREATRLGALLRRYSLDELPQLWNVLRGDMSIIGPRPERLSYVERFSPAIYRYAERHRVKPGLTGWAQVNGLRGETSLTDRVEWDNYYVENWSWTLELRILVRTVAALRMPVPTSAVVVEGSHDGEPPAGPVPASVIRRQVRRAAYKLAATLLLLAFMVLAIATSNAGASVSAVDQYVEALPTASGPLSVSASTEAGATGGSHGGGEARGLPLSPLAQSRLRQLDTSTARRLEVTATAPKLGAPTRRLPSATPNQRTPNAVNAAAKAITSDPGGQLTWLLVVLGATSILAVSAAVNGRLRGQRRT